ncbi:MAG TPA: hypothetical protein VMT53_07345 [Terriglobales bacterium]|nr:hypothetical protein [Terriglobales bacterium]
MSSINRIMPDPASTHAQPASDRADARRGVSTANQQITDQNRNMEQGNVTAPPRVSDEFKKSAIDIRQQEQHAVRARRHIDKRA